MTIKAFAEKYKIPYGLAVKAAVPVPHKPTIHRDFDYLEKDLYLSLMSIIDERIHVADMKVNALRQKHREVKNIAICSGLLTRKV